MTAPAAKRRGRWLKLILGGLIALVVLWCAYWLAARTIAGSAIDRFVGSLVERGGRADCSERGIGGFPFALDVSCTSLGFADAAGNSVGLEALRAGAPLYRPGEINLSLSGPLALSLPREPEPITATWSEALAQARITLSGLSSLSAQLRALHIEAAGLPPATLGEVGLSASLSGADYRLIVTIGDGEVGMAGGTTALKVGAGADLTALDVGSAPGSDPAGILLAWLRAGGAVRIDRLVLSANRSEVSAIGNLALAEDGLLSGELTVTMTGLDTLADTAEMVLSGTRDEAERLVELVKGFARQVKEGETTSYELRLGIRNGRVSLGFIPLARIPALAF